jgi:hypothetical protein
MEVYILADRLESLQQHGQSTIPPDAASSSAAFSLAAAPTTLPGGEQESEELINMRLSAHRAKLDCLRRDLMVRFSFPRLRWHTSPDASCLVGADAP